LRDGAGPRIASQRTENEISPRYVGGKSFLDEQFSNRKSIVVLSSASLTLPQPLPGDGSDHEQRGELAALDGVTGAPMYKSWMFPLLMTVGGRWAEHTGYAAGVSLALFFYVSAIMYAIFASAPGRIE